MRGPPRERKACRLLARLEADAADSNNDDNDDDNHHTNNHQPQLEVLPPHGLLQCNSVALEGIGLNGDVLRALHEIFELLTALQNIRCGFEQGDSSALPIPFSKPAE